ncbi:MAG: hypothetical protein Q7N50_04065 [Armatimonadota bacterium]|nr:hypothetical protein [Armatimonadota bacterium]
MPKDRLEDDNDRVFNLEDLIEAREERASAFADDVDALEDVAPTDVDIQDALTFPHPKHNHEEAAREVETMDTPREEDVGFDYQDSQEEMLPVEYTENYSELITTHLADDEDEIAEEQIEEIGELSGDDLIYGTQQIETPTEGGPRDVDSDERRES